MIIAADTSALVALSSIERLDLLRLTFSEVWLPPAVVDELTAGSSGRWAAAAQALRELGTGEWVKRWTGDFPLLPAPSRKLGLGEIEAVSLAHFQTGTCFIDDHRGRAFARDFGVRTVGSLGVLCLAKTSGRIPALKPLFLGMSAGGIYFAPELINRVLLEMGE